MLGGETAEITQDFLLFTKSPVLLDQEYEKHNIKWNKIRIVSFQRQKWDCPGSLLCLRFSLSSTGWNSCNSQMNRYDRTGDDIPSSRQ